MKHEGYADMTVGIYSFGAASLSGWHTLVHNFKLSVTFSFIQRHKTFGHTSFVANISHRLVDLWLDGK
ncbi:Uncharacterized protein TCM_015611 [Theobroma cacao]|uniref:Uncharacterized protein n=1 Tax=Theobroma cacao TaxID=3641 RepID=A0A061G2P1_THECC|nr:Uncharacterized protein TCM_015611 [Theobroma cacao]